MEDKIKLTDIPESDVKDGLLIRFDKATDTETEFAFTDIHKGQQDYQLPDDPRQIIGVYKKL